MRKWEIGKKCLGIQFVRTFKSLLHVLSMSVSVLSVVYLDTIIPWHFPDLFDAT
jgi:hypothetical protein